MDHSFSFLSIPLFNKAKLDLNSSVRCKEGDAAVYRYSGSNTLNHYPTPEIAASWNSNWSNTTNIDCSTYQMGEQLVKKNQADLKMGQTVRCGTATISVPVEGFQTEGFQTEGFRWWRKKKRRNPPPPPPPPPPPIVYREVTVPSGDSFRYVGENMLRVYPNASVGNNWDSGWNQGGAVNCTTYKVGKPMTTESDGVGVELVESPRYIYVSNNVAMLATSIEIDLSKAVFSFQTPKYDISCNIKSLQNICNQTGDCIGFVQAPSNNTWQMIKTNSSSDDYNITGTMQDVYVRDATVNLLDNSCEPGPVDFIKGSVLEHYPMGDALIQGKGNDKCKVVNAPRGKVSNDAKRAQRIVDRFPNVQNDPTPRIQMKEKTDEYIDVLDKIKKTKPNVTLEQQYKDMTVFDEQNRAALILWAVVSVSIIGFVYFRMKS